MQCCETPLHFACKFGKADVVEYLLSSPGVETTVPNKDGKTAEQVFYTLGNAIFLIDRLLDVRIYVVLTISRI